MVKGISKINALLLMKSLYNGSSFVPSNNLIWKMFLKTHLQPITLRSG